MKLIGVLESPNVRRVAVSLQLLGLRFAGNGAGGPAYAQASPGAPNTWRTAFSSAAGGTPGLNSATAWRSRPASTTCL